MGAEEPVVPLKEIEKADILKVCDNAGENKTRTTELLRIELNTLRRKLKSYGAK